MGLNELYSEDVKGVLDVSHELNLHCYSPFLAKGHYACEHVGVPHKNAQACANQLPMSQPIDELVSQPVTQPLAYPPQGAASVTTGSPQGSPHVATSAVPPAAASPPDSTSVATEVYASNQLAQPASPNPKPEKKSRMADLMA